MVNRKRYSSILSGILLGAAIGTGFAIYESMAYAMKEMLPLVSGADSSSIFSQMGDSFNCEKAFMMTLRGFLSPFTQIIWSALVGGALWRVKEDRRFRFGMLFDCRFLVILLCSIGMHFAWYYDWDFKVVTDFDKRILLGVFGWVLMGWMLKKGMCQSEEEIMAAMATAAPACDKKEEDVLAMPEVKIFPEEKAQPQTEAKPEAAADAGKKDEALSCGADRAWKKYYQK